MSNKLPLILTALTVGAISVVYLIYSGDNKPMRAEPPQGRACFEQLRNTLPPGTQYEGARAEGDRIRIKVMDGVELRELECMVDSSGMPHPAHEK